MSDTTTKAVWKAVPQSDVKVGDFATHRYRELDARPVADVSHFAGSIMLDIGGQEVGPVDIEDYTYQRRIEG